MANGSEYMWYECGKAFYLRESELELEYHVFAHCSILCYAFQGMLLKLSEGMCTGMVVCLRLALAHVTYDTPSIRFHFFFLFLFSLLDHTLFCYKNQNICLAMIWSNRTRKLVSNENFITLPWLLALLYFLDCIKPLGTIIGSWIIKKTSNYYFVTSW